MSKVCSKCGGDGPFPATGGQCKACRAEYKANWYQHRHPGARRRLASQQKEARRVWDGTCSKCGSSGPFPPRGKRCIACKKLANKQTQANFRKNSPEKALAAVKRYQEKNPEKNLRWKRESMQRARTATIKESKKNVYQRCTKSNCRGNCEGCKRKREGK